MYYKDLVFWNNFEIIQFKGAIKDLELFELGPSKLGSTKGRCDNYPMERAGISLPVLGTCEGGTCPTCSGIVRPGLSGDTIGLAATRLREMKFGEKTCRQQTHLIKFH